MASSNKKQKAQTMNKRIDRFDYIRTEYYTTTVTIDKVK